MEEEEFSSDRKATRRKTESMKHLSCCQDLTASSAHQGGVFVSCDCLAAKGPILLLTQINTVLDLYV